MSETVDPRENAEAPLQTYDIEDKFTGWVFSEGRFGSFQVGLLYTKDDPVCSVLRFYKPDGEPEADWEFSRGMLDWGYYEPCGTGTFKFESHDPNFIGIRINPPNDFEAYAYLPRPMVRSYLDKTYDLVSPEQEQAIIDRAFDQWVENELYRAPQEPEGDTSPASA